MSNNQQTLKAAQELGFLSIVHVGDSKPAAPVAAKPERDQDFAAFFTPAVEPVAEAAKVEPVNPNDAFEIGDILYCSWGYEQTNIDFYQVVDKRGKTTLVLREVNADRDYCPERMTGIKTPRVDDFYGEEEQRVRVSKDGYVKIQQRYYLYPLEYTEVDGKRQYSAKGYTTYA